MLRTPGNAIAAVARARGERTRKACERSAPDLHFAFEQDLIAVEYFFADHLHERQNILSRAARVRDDEVGVLLADFRATDAAALEAGLIDQRAGAEAARILENASGILGVQRLRVPLIHPDFL